MMNTPDIPESMISPVELGTAPVQRNPVLLNHPEEQRQGTISSARFNIWSTMVGGGSLSLPLAFAKTGNLFLGPVLLISTALLTEFCFGVLLDAARFIAPNTPSDDPARNRDEHERDNTDGVRSTLDENGSPESVSPEAVGKDSLESITAAAFGGRAHWASTVLVTLMCWFGIIGYTVLLRDMLVPVTNWIVPAAPPAISAFLSSSNMKDDSGSTVSIANNITMLLVVLMVTPLCTLRTLTSLQRFGAASMLSVFILGMCILYRSVECTLGIIQHSNTTMLGSDVSRKMDDEMLSPLRGSFQSHFMDGFTFFPKSWKDVLDVLPLFISCYVCHYNLPVVHNDLTNPTPTRVRRWISTTVWGATLFYLIMGIAGSAFAMACADDKVHGNILLNFDANDPLLLVGRLCLAITIALAFPVLTIPARDIFLRAMANAVPSRTMEEHFLHEPLLPASANVDGDASSDPPVMAAMNNEDADVTLADLGVPEARPHFAPSTWMSRLGISILILWSGAIVASCVSSIDIVWDFLGSSLSILLSYLVPCGSYICLRRRHRPDMPPHNESNRDIVRPPQLPSVSVFCWMIVLFFFPLIFLSTANAMYNAVRGSSS